MSGVDDLDTENLDERIVYHEHLEQLAHLIRGYHVLKIRHGSLTLNY